MDVVPVTPWPVGISIEFCSTTLFVPRGQKVKVHWQKVNLAFELIKLRLAAVLLSVSVSFSTANTARGLLQSSESTVALQQLRVLPPIRLVTACWVQAWTNTPKSGLGENLDERERGWNRWRITGRNYEEIWLFTFRNECWQGHSEVKRNISIFSAQ